MSRDGPERGQFSDLLSAHSRWVAAGLVAFHLVLCSALFDPKVHTGGDSVTYVLLAESILESGDGYSLSLEPGPPEPHTKYPPGYPLFLAPLVAIFGRNFVVLKLLSTLFTAGSVALFCGYARRGRDALPWFWVALAFAVSPGVIDYSRWMLSEAPFLFFTLGALWMLREDARGTGAGRPFWLALAASVMSFYVRSIGALLLVATSLSYLLRREWRKFLIHGTIGAGLTIPWLVRSRLVTGTTSSYFEEFLLENVYAPEAGYLDLFGMAGRFFENGWLYATRELPRALVGSDSAWGANPLVAVVAVVVCTLVLWELVRRFRRGPGAAELYFVLTCAAIMLFQTSVNDVRYLVPLLPLFLVYAADGIAALGGSVQRKPRSPAHARRRKRPAAPRTRARGASGTLGRSLAPAYLAGALAALAMGAHAARIPGNLDMITRYSAGDRYAGYHPAWQTFFDAAQWVEANTPADAVVTVRKPRLFSALTDRRVVIYPFSSDADSVLQVVRTTDYVVVDAIFGTTRQYLVPAVQQHPAQFVIVHQTAAPLTFVLGVSDDPHTGNP